MDAIIRLIEAVLLEANDEWQLQHRYMQTEVMAELTPPLIDAVLRPPCLGPARTAHRIGANTLSRCRSPRGSVKRSKLQR